MRIISFLRCCFLPLTTLWFSLRYDQISVTQGFCFQLQRMQQKHQITLFMTLSFCPWPHTYLHVTTLYPLVVLIMFINWIDLVLNKIKPFYPSVGLFVVVVCLFLVLGLVLFYFVCFCKDRKNYLIWFQHSPQIFSEELGDVSSSRHYWHWTFCIVRPWPLLKLPKLTLTGMRLVKSSLTTKFPGLMNSPEAEFSRGLTWQSGNGVHACWGKAEGPR